MAPVPGGVFLTARDPGALAAWYRANLGAPPDPGPTVWAGAVRYRVRDLAAALARLAAAGAHVEYRVEDTPLGRCGGATDPEGNRFELWEPR